MSQIHPNPLHVTGNSSIIFMLSNTLVSAIALLPHTLHAWNTLGHLYPPTIDSSTIQGYCGCQYTGSLRRTIIKPPKYFDTYMTNDYCLDTNPDGRTITGKLRPGCMCTEAIIANGGLDVTTNNYRVACDCKRYLNKKNGFMNRNTNASFYKPACGSIYNWSKFGNGTVYVDPNA